MRPQARLQDELRRCCGVSGLPVCALPGSAGMRRQAATAGSPPWTKYAPTILKLAKYFGGGKHAPLLYKLDSFAKTIGEDRKLGDEFLSAIVNIKWPNSKEFPRVIDALLTCNTVSAKVVDGIARTRNDNVRVPMNRPYRR